MSPNIVGYLKNSLQSETFEKIWVNDQKQIGNIALFFIKECLNNKLLHFV